MVEECGENITTEQLKDYVWKTLNSGKVRTLMRRFGQLIPIKIVHHAFAECIILDLVYLSAHLCSRMRIQTL